MKPEDTRACTNCWVRLPDNTRFAPIPALWIPLLILLSLSTTTTINNNSIGDDEEEVDDNDILGDGAEGVGKNASAAGEGAVGDGDELPAELRMDDYDDEPGPSVAASRGEGGEEGDSDSDGDDGADAADAEPHAMDEDSDDEEGGEEGGNMAAMGVSLLEEPSTGQVFAYESEGEDSDTEDNIIKPGDHVLLTASTEEVCYAAPAAAAATSDFTFSESSA